ncbi:MAG: hypothetical protein QNJ15_09100 [Erythrobacter sp.]|nr:hypothetical protein [Erythrobacter sp.]
MNFEEILGSVVAALKEEIGDDLSSIQGFIDSQGRLLAKQTAWIATSRTTGSLKDDDELYEFFVENLKTNTEGFVRSIAMHTIITIEKAWNAVANVLWGAIRTALTGVGIPNSMLPETPPFSA